MILLPLLSLGFLILCLMGALVSFQYFTHFQSLALLQRAYVADQHQRAQGALGVLVAFSFAAVIALGGIVVPAALGFSPEPVQPQPGESPLPTLVAPSPADETSASQPASESPPTALPQAAPTTAPAATLPMATIGNTGGVGANLRSVPGLAGAVIAVLGDGTRVILLEETRLVDGYNWQAIEIEDTRQGWIVAQYLIPDE